MKVTTILLLGAATLVAYASAHPYSKITEGGSLPDKYNFKRTSSSSNSNSYSQSTQDAQDVSGAYLGRTFSGSKSSGSSSTGGSHSQSSSFSSSSFNGQIPLNVIGGSGVSGISQHSLYGQPALALGNPGTGSLGLSNQGSGFASAGSFGSSYGGHNAGGNSATSDDQISQVAQTGYGAAAGQGFNQLHESGSLNSDSGIYGSTSEGSFGQQVIPTSGIYVENDKGYFGQSGSSPGALQYWWNGPDSPFGLVGKPSGGCGTSACTLSGQFDLNKGSGGAHAANHDGQVGLNINGGNPFLSGGNADSGSGFIASGATIGQNGLESGSGSTFGAGSGSTFNQIPIQGSNNPFLNGGYAGGTSGSSFNAGSGSFASSNSATGAASAGSFTGAGNPFLKPGSASEKIPLNLGPSSTVAPGYSGTQGSGFINRDTGSINPFFKPGSGSVVLTPPISGFPGQSDQGFPQQPSPLPGFTDQSTNSGSSGSFGSAGADDFQSQIGSQFPSFPSQSTIGSTGFPSIPSSIPDQQQQTIIDDGLSVSCSGEGKICALKNLCVNGRISGIGQGLTQVRTGPQFCKTGIEVCCTLNEYSGSSTFGTNQQQGSQFSSTGSTTNSFAGSNGNYGGVSGITSGKPITPSGNTGNYGQTTGNFGQNTGNFGQTTENQGQTTGNFGQTTGNFGQNTGNFGQTTENQGQTTGNFGQSTGNFGQTAGNYGKTTENQGQTIGNFGQTTGNYGKTTGNQGQNTGNFGQTTENQGQSGQYDSNGQYDQQSVNSGSFGIFGQKEESESADSYDQNQRKESTNFGSNFGIKTSTNGGSTFGNRGGNGFNQKYPSTGQENTFGKPIGGNYNVGGNTGSASAGANAYANGNANANTAASGQAGSSISGTGINNNGKNSGPLTGGLFGSSDDSGEDLSAGEPSFSGISTSGIKGATASNGYLPPIGSEPSSNVPAYSELPKEDNTPTNVVPVIRQPFVPAPITVQVGCAAALICVEERFCTLEGVISPQPVALTSQQIERRAPLSSCKNPDNGIIGKCCRDPNYVDPWPTGNLPANYSGGFDEQGFPTYLNYAKTQAAKKRPSVGTKGGFRQPIKVPSPAPGPNQKGWVEDLGQAFTNFTSGFPQWNLPSFPFPGQQPAEKPVEGGDTNGESVADSQVTDKPTGSSPPGLFGITLPTFPTFTFPNNPFLQNQGGNRNYDSSASNESPTIIAPHTPGAQCGLRNKVQRPSGLDYDDVAFGEIPWQAMVLSTKDRKLLCSGAFVSPNAVLTAAHCVDGFNSGEVSVKAGEWKLGYELKHEEPLPFEIIAVSNVVPHPGFKSGLPSHDFAILFLEHPVKLDQHVDFLCLGDTPQPKPGRKCISTGWGKVVLQVNVAGAVMHSIDVDIVPQGECAKRLEGAESQVDIDNTLTCVKPHNQRNNMCQVDVGGPLACDRGDGQYELTGVYSQDTGCLPTNQVATFALIDTNWVESSLESGLANPSRVPSPSLEIGLPASISESSSANSVETKFQSEVEQPAKSCDCQKSNLPGELNQYLPPV